MHYPGTLNTHAAKIQPLEPWFGNITTPLYSHLGNGSVRKKELWTHNRSHKVLNRSKIVLGKFVVTTTAIFRKKNTANCNGELSGTLISAQTTVWFGKLVLPRQTRYWYQRGHGGAPGVLRFALRQWYMVCMRTRSMDFECLGSQSACRMCQSPPIASNSSTFGPGVYNDLRMGMRMSFSKHAIN